MRSRLPLSLVAICLSACLTTSDGSLPSLVVDDEGKADNYYSDVAAEFEVSGSVPVVLSEEELADPAAVDEAVARRLTAVGLYLTTYVTDKFRGIDRNDDGEISEDEIFFHNVDYGGFHAMVRNYTVSPVELTGDATTGHVAAFTIDLAGPPDLLGMIPPDEGTTPGAELQFSFRMPEGATMDPENVARRTARRFDPSTYDGELETVRCSARRLPEPGNAYPAFDAFVSDGLYDITLFFGHDYNESRSDLREAEEAFHTLEAEGFTLPGAVQSFDALRHDSGPFVREVTAGGQPVRMEVRIFHSTMFENERRLQHDLALSELASRDVFFYNGHAGPYYGFYLDEDGLAEVGYHEFRSAQLDPARQQLFIAQGCQTYSQYADMLYAHPAKSEDNLDVVVTVNYSYGRGTMSILRNLIRVADGRHQPTDFYQIVADLNDDWLNDWNDVFYGVTGIDGNGQLHPYGNVAAIGSPCSEAADCGDPAGNLCVDQEGGAACVVRTLSGDACPDGTVFAQADTTPVCAKPADEDEGGQPDGPSAGAVMPSAHGELVISEVMVNPDAVADRAGEWLEVANPSSSVAFDLVGCTIGDDAGNGHVIERSVVVSPGGFATLARSADAGFVPSYVYGGSLQLANTADELVLQCGGVVIDSFAYSGGVRAGRSLALSPTSLDAVLNDDRGFWCAGSEAYNRVGARSDLGTPGGPNAPCE